MLTVLMTDLTSDYNKTRGQKYDMSNWKKKNQCEPITPKADVSNQQTVALWSTLTFMCTPSAQILVYVPIFHFEKREILRK